MCPKTAMPGSLVKAISLGHYGKIRANCSGMSASPPVTQISKSRFFLSFYCTLSEFIFPFGSDGLANETSFHFSWASKENCKKHPVTWSPLTKASAKGFPR